MADLNVDGMALAPGVVETIVSIAAKEVEGVASIGSWTVNGLKSVFASKTTVPGVEVEVRDDNTLAVTVRIEVYSGYVLPDVANSLRQAVAEAVKGQVGIAVENVDVYIDGIQFAN